jgi:ribonucleotide reductase alpha subunit
MSQHVGAGEVSLPIKRTVGDTLEDRLTDNAYDNILPARYLLKDADGDVIEAQEDLFERVAKNIALAEAVFEARNEDLEVTVTPDQLKPDHPRRDELAEEVFGKGTTAQDDVETTLTAYNVNKFAYETVVPELPEGIREHVEETAAQFQELMENLDWIPNSPTLMNAGDELQQLSACFVMSPDDDITDIHETAKNAAEVFQSGGGCGYAFWQLRPYGDAVGSTGGIASGPITFMRTYDQLCETIAQGGARRGAQMGVMRVSHPDVIQFIHAKNKDVSLAHTLRLNDPDDFTHNSFADALAEARELIDDEGRVPKHLRNAVEGHLSNFNISVGVTHDFMEAVKAGEEYTFTNPRTGEPHVATEQTVELYEMFGLGEYAEAGEVLSVPAGEIWDRIVEGAHENGEPGVIFLERVNDEHSFDVDEHPEHRILATNPCLTGDTEIALADGTTETLASLAENGQDVRVLCRNSETGELTVKIGRNPRQTRTDADLVRVETEDGTTLRCTPDHEIWTPDGYVEAGDLSTGDRIVGTTAVAIPAGGVSETVSEELTVESVSDAGSAPVYNITVDDHHNYLAITEGEDDAPFVSVANCGEQPLEEYEACNLGHINLSTLAAEDAPDWRVWAERHADEHGSRADAVSAFLAEAVDWEEFDRRVELGTRFLENVVTMSDFPVEEIEQTVRRMRKIGLGIMGLAQLYIQLGMKYGSDPANEVARQLMTHINHHSKWTSHELATERSSFEDWEDSKYADPTAYREWFEGQTGLDADEWADGFPVRNHNTTTIAPTGTTSMVGNTTGGCEPIYNVAYYKNVSDDVQGDEMLVEFDDYFLRVLEANDIDVEAVKEEAQEQMAENAFEGIEGLTSVPDAIGELFVTTGDLSAKEHAAVQCSCQEGVDSAISKCLEKGTLVQTDTGVRPIESFTEETPEPGEFVTVDEDVTIDGVPVESQYYAGEKEATRVRVDNGTELVGATESHRVLTPDGWKVLGDLGEGDYVIGRHTESHGNGGTEIAFDRLTDVATDGGAALTAPGSDPGIYEKDVTLPSRMSPRLAQFLGMYAADGSAIDERYCIEISTSSERVRDEARELFEELFGREPFVEEDTRGSAQRDTVYGVHLNSKPVWEFVTDLCESGSYAKEVPREVLQGSPDEKLAFVNGVTLDGYVGSQSLVVYGGMSKDLADGVADLLRSFGIPKVYVGRKWIKESDAYAYQVHVTNEAQELVTPVEPHKRVERFDQRYRVYVPQDRVDKTEFDSRSREYYAARTFEYRDRNYMFHTTAADLGIDDAPPLYEVTEVEDAGTREMYDIELAGPHEYVVGGVVSHNTVNAPNDSSVADAKEVFEYIYDHGGKGVTYYRDGTRSKQVLTTRAKNTEFADEAEAAEALVEQIEDVFGGIEAFVGSEEVQAALDQQIGELLGSVDDGEEFAQKRDRPDVLRGVTQRIDTGYGKLYVNINEDPEADRPFELFANIGNSGGFTASFTEALAKTISTALRAGVDPWEIAEELQGIRSPKVAWDKGEQIQSIPDAIGTAMRRYLEGDIERAYPQQQTLEETAEDAEADSRAERDAAPEPDIGGVEPEPEADGGAAAASEGDQQSLIDAGESPECPECGALSLYYSEGCKTCESCGWSEC